MPADCTDIRGYVDAMTLWANIEPSIPPFGVPETSLYSGAVS